jgi:hypothetical protein
MKKYRTKKQSDSFYRGLSYKVPVSDVCVLDVRNMDYVLLVPRGKSSREIRRTFRAMKLRRAR